MEPLGAGGMGVVYKAVYRKNGRVVALKLLTPALSANPKLVARFEREMSILEKLDHPNITRYYGGGRTAGQHFYAMKLMTGGTLDDLLKKRGPLPWEQVVKFAQQICDALDHAHTMGIIHRDLKPANLFLRHDRDTGDETLVLGDFGIARDTESTALTSSGMTVGTYAYMAPEQINGKKPVSARTDLYALGCVLFQMLTGRPPFLGDSPAELLVQHLQNEPPRLRELAPDCPVWLEGVVMRLLAKEPDDRPLDAPYVRMALDEVLSKVASGAGVSTQMVTGGPTTMTAMEMHPDLKKLLKHGRSRKKKKRDSSPFYERAWFLSSVLLLLLGLVVWSVWPDNEADLFAQARPLMDSEDPLVWREAVDRYLQPMLERYPDGENAVVAREFVEKVEVHRLQRRLINATRLNRDPESEAERQFMDAWRFEQFGDRISALDRYRGMIVLLKDRPDDRLFVALARLQIAGIEEAADGSQDRVGFVNGSLSRAEDLLAAGRRLDAEKIWNSIISLYSANQEFEPQTKYARARLRGETPEPLNFESSGDSAPSTGATSPKSSITE